MHTENGQNVFHLHRHESQDSQNKALNTAGKDPFSVVMRHDRKQNAFLLTQNNKTSQIDDPSPDEIGLFTRSITMAEPHFDELHLDGKALHSRWAGRALPNLALMGYKIHIHLHPREIDSDDELVLERMQTIAQTEPTKGPSLDLRATQFVCFDDYEWDRIDQIFKTELFSPKNEGQPFALSCDVILENEKMRYAPERLIWVAGPNAQAHKAGGTCVDLTRKVAVSTFAAFSYEYLLYTIENRLRSIAPKTGAQEYAVIAHRFGYILAAKDFHYLRRENGLPSAIEIIGPTPKSRHEKIASLTDTQMIVDQILPKYCAWHDNSWSKIRDILVI